MSKKDERYDPNGPYLETVSARIGGAVMSFYRARVAGHKFQFHADELRNWVISEVDIAAPASADRILRDLRQKGRLDYRLISRSQSLYEFRHEPEQQNLWEDFDGRNSESGAGKENRRGL